MLPGEDAEGGPQTLVHQRFPVLTRQACAKRGYSFYIIMAIALRHANVSDFDIIIASVFLILYDDDAVLLPASFFRNVVVNLLFRGHRIPLCTTFSSPPYRRLPQP